MYFITTKRMLEVCFFQHTPTFIIEPHLFAYSGNVCTDADSHRKRFTEFIPTHGKPGKIRIKMKKISEKNPSWHTEDVDFF